MQAMLGAFNRPAPRGPETETGERPIAATEREAEAIEPTADDGDVAAQPSAPATSADDSGEGGADRYSYGNMFEVVLVGCTPDGVEFERLGVSYAYMDPLFDIVSRHPAPSDLTRPPRLASQWLAGTGWCDSAGAVPVSAGDAQALATALARVCAAHFDDTHPPEYVADCVRCAAAVCEFIERQLTERRMLTIRNA